MKILVLACFKNYQVYGGSEKVIINLSNWLAEQNLDVTLASVEGKLAPYKVSNKTKYIESDIKHKNKLITHYRMYKRTQEIINDVRPDVIISFWIYPLFYSLFNKNNKNSIKIFSERNDPKSGYGILLKTIRKILLKNIDGVVFQTNMAKEYFDKNIQLKSIVIHNPVYLKKDDFELTKQFDDRIVNVGRLYPQKNQSLLIKAFSKILPIYPNLKLEIYGDGFLHDDLQKLIESLHLEEKVFLMGTTKNVINEIYGARLFVLSSSYEGMPNSLMEAMCLGIPAISSDCPCGGSGEIIEDGKNGYLYECNNLDSLIIKITEALENKNILEISQNEKNICDTHSQNTIFSKWLEFIIDLNRKGN